MAVDKKLLDIMACPKCKGDIKEREMFLLCSKCKLAFPVLEGTIPNMLIDEAWPIKKAEKNRFRHTLKLSD